MYFVKRCDEKKAEARSDTKKDLEEFLLPLQRVFASNKRLQETLTTDPEISGGLEHAPDYLRKRFAELPDSDSRKHSWRHLIEEIMSDSERALQIIDSKQRYTISDEFNIICDEFREHHKRWKSYWLSVIDQNVQPIQGRCKLKSHHFQKAWTKCYLLKLNRRRTAL